MLWVPIRLFFFFKKKKLDIAFLFPTKSQSFLCSLEIPWGFEYDSWISMLLFVHSQVKYFLHDVLVDFDRLLIQRLPSSCYTPKIRSSKVQFLSTFKWIFLHNYANSKMANTVEDRTLTFLPAGCWPIPSPTLGSSLVTPAFHSEILTGVEI